MKMHTSEVTSCCCTSSGVGMEQSQFFNHLCSKYQVDYLAAAIQVEQKLSRRCSGPAGFLKPLARSASLRRLSLRRTAQFNASCGSRGDLALYYFDLCFFFIQVCEAECGEKTPTPTLPSSFQKMYICTQGTTTLCSKY